MAYIVLTSVVMLLGSAQWPTVSSVPTGLNDRRMLLDDDFLPQDMNFPLDGNFMVRYQGDMILTARQWRSLNQRQAEVDETKRWPKNATTGTVNIDYRYNDGNVSRKGVQQALSTWENATCVRFFVQEKAVAKPHLIFKDHETACDSLLGYQSDMNGQNVNLAAGCFNANGVVVHEVGHALGLYHEQSRSDRDEYLTMLPDNFEAGRALAFAKSITNNFGLPYDYSSMMHYFPTEMSKNGQYTLITKNPLAMVLLTPPIKMSFMDKKIVNLMYKCIDTWLVKCGKTTDPCKNQGYIKSDCKCECPEGTSGAFCETLNMPYIDALIKAKSPDSRRIITEGTVTSPSYPTPVKTETITVQSIEAPECSKVQLTFTAFDLSDKSDVTPEGATKTVMACYYMILKIQLDDPPVVFNEYCGGNFTAPKVFESVGRNMVLTYTTKNYTENTKAGYNATIKFIPVAGNCKPSAGGITNSGVLPVTPSSSTGSCSLVSSSNSSVFSYLSPNYPSNYNSGQGCTMLFSTTEPRYLKVTSQILQLGYYDTMSVSDYKTTTSLNSRNVGKAITLMTSSSKFTFQDSTMSPTGRFNISVEVVNSGCHQLINLNVGSTGNINIPANYPPGTLCEWWFKAPTGRKVQVAFSSFSMGDMFCWSDFAVIDLSGDSKYATNSTRYCGGNSPGKVVSIGNALNILANGQKGNSTGFSAIYTVV